MLSNSQYNNKTEDILVAAITSNIDEKEYSLIIKSEDLCEGFLKIDSCIRVDKIYTLSQNIVVKRFGKVNDNIIIKVKEILNTLM